MKGKDFITLAALEPADLKLILDQSQRLKQERKRGKLRSALRGRTLALIFEKHSTRTRVSFEVAMSELGGDHVSLSSAELQQGRGETIEDTAGVLSRFVHAIMARVLLHEDLVRLAEAATIPVINGLSNLHHPAQVLADIFTLAEHKKGLKGLRVAWVGDGNNVCNSWLHGAALSGIDFVAATPRAYRPMSSVVREAKKIASLTGATIRLTEDPIEAVKDADCVMTDTFVSMGFEQEQEERLRAFIPRYRVDKKLMSYAKRNAIFEHCMPVHRGEEVAGDVVDGPQSVVFDQAENRLHTAKALLLHLMARRTKTSRA